MNSVAKTCRNDELVSVVIPTYNSEKTIEDALRSVSAQSYRAVEVIVVDDASADDTLRAIASSPYGGQLVRIVRLEKNAGPAEARNRGIEEARGRYVAFLDSDDVMYPHRLTMQIAALQRDSSLGMVGSHVSVIDEAGRDTGIVWRRPVAQHVARIGLLFRNTFSMATSIRKEAIPDGGFGALPMAEDYVFNAGIAHKWHVKNVDAVLTRVRRRPTGLTSTRPVLMEKCVRIVVANELRRLGIVCTDREMSVHRFLGVHSGEPFGITLDEVHEWLKKLERGNRESATHDVREFRRVLSVEWYQGCLSLSRLGLRVCDQYMRSPFARAGDVGIVDRLRLVAKCAIRHRRRA